MNKIDTTVNTLTGLLLQGWIFSIGLSGKDSFCVAHCAIEALTKAKSVRDDVGPIYLATTDTTLDNFEVHKYVMSIHGAAVQFGKNNSLDIRSECLSPALSSLPMVDYIGKGKLLRTPQTARKGRDCAVSWKIEPAKKFLKSLNGIHQTNKILSLSGTRDDESVVRAKNIAKRGESISTVVKTEIGYTLAPIKDWTKKDVWGLIGAIEDDKIESFAEDVMAGMRKHYSAANGGMCDAFTSDGKKSARACGARHGCVICAMVTNDTSLENQIDIDPKRYGYMEGFTRIRKFMLDTLFDYERSRSLVGRETKAGGWIKVGYNQYSMLYRQELLRYFLTLDAIEDDAAERDGHEPRFQLIDEKTLLTIQYHWSREGGEKTPGEALQIWHDIYTEGNRYAIPETHNSPKTYLDFDYANLSYVAGTEFPKYRWLNINDFADQVIDFSSLDLVGLSPTGVDIPLSHAPKVKADNGSYENVVPFRESDSFSICQITDAQWFIEDTFKDLVELGMTDPENQVDPTEMLKFMLYRNVIIIHKGSMARLHRETKRAQLINAITRAGRYFETVFLAHSITEDQYIQLQQKQEDDHPQACLAV
jgi:DNA sulfur modification protein DndC